MICPLCDTEMQKLFGGWYCPKPECGCEWYEGTVNQVTVHLVSSSGKKKEYAGVSVGEIFKRIHADFNGAIYDWYGDQNIDQFWDSGYIEGVLQWWKSNPKRQILVVME